MPFVSVQLVLSLLASSILHKQTRRRPRQSTLARRVLVGRPVAAETVTLYEALVGASEGGLQRMLVPDDDALRQAARLPKAQGTLSARITGSLIFCVHCCL